jgi:hypothetical protein
LPGSPVPADIQSQSVETQIHPTEGITPASSFPTFPPPDVTSTYPTDKSQTILPVDWMSLPVIPSISDTAREIYKKGALLGRDPHAFSKIGDCQSISTYFLSYFDLPDYYELGTIHPTGND